MKLLFSTLIASIIATSAVAAEKLYILNTGSTGGSYNAQTQAWAKDLANDYDIELIQSKGCQKALALMSKIDGNILTMFSGNWVNREGCEDLIPTVSSHLYTDQKIGLIFSRKDSTQFLLDDGVTIAYNSGREHYIKYIAEMNGVKLNPIEYKNSKEIVLAVLNGEVDFGYTDSAKDVWKNTDKLVANYNLSDSELNGIPSVTEIKGKVVASTVNFLYFGNSKSFLREKMQIEFQKPESAIKAYHDNQKGLKSFIMSNPATSWMAFASTQ